jgi:hypothetical protein
MSGQRSPARKALARTLLVAALLLTALSAAGCAGAAREGERLNQVLRDSLDRQTEMNKTILQQNREVAEAARRLVVSDGQSRKEFVALQRQIQEERLALLRQREAMEAELKNLAQQRHRDPVVAAALTQAAFLLAVAMCLAFCWYVLRRLGAESDEAALRDLLLQELVSDQPILLAPPAATPPAIAPPAARAIAPEKKQTADFQVRQSPGRS